MSLEPSLARRGLDLLLASCPHLELVEADWQADGPWLLVTLGQRSDAWPPATFARHPYAIWKRTGAVHGMLDGAVTDDPVLRVDRDASDPLEPYVEALVETLRAGLAELEAGELEAGGRKAHLVESLREAIAAWEQRGSAGDALGRS